MSTVAQIIQYELAVAIGCGEMVANEVVVYEVARAGSNPFMVIGVGPVIKGAGDTVEDGVRMDVAAQMEQIALVGDGLDFDRPFEDSATVLIFQVVGLAITVEDALGEQTGTG